MNDATPEPRLCEVCARRLFAHNTVGICQLTPECRRAYNERMRRARGQLPKVRKQCGHPDGCPRMARRDDLCPMHAQRLKRTGKLGPAGSLRKEAVVRAGDTFGRWTALEDYDRKTGRRILCRCECERGTEKRVDVWTLRNGTSRSCGCLQRDVASLPRSRGPKGVYLRAGFVSGRLTALEDAVYANDRIRFRCEDGTEVVKLAESVKNGRTRSCGCLNRDVSTRHGLSGHPLYAIWGGIIRRCERPENAAYKRYGARGITVCERWRGLPDGLLNFAADMGPRPPGMSVDRWPDNNGPYSPDNTRWGTAKQQNDNRRTVEKIEQERDALAVRLAEVERQLAEARGALF